MSDFYILTQSGRKVDLAELKPEQISLIDIAHGLSQVCRFNGQCRRPYMVAEHCIWGSFLAEEKWGLGLEFLLHDAHEAYTGDLNGVCKWMMVECEENELGNIEDALDEAISERLGIPKMFRTGGHTRQIHLLDLFMLKEEAMTLLPYDHEKDPFPVLRGVDFSEFGEGPSRFVQARIANVPGPELGQAFVDRFQNLYQKRHGARYEE